MARVAGIQFNKTPGGKIKSVTIDLKKHGEVINTLLEKLDAIEEDEFEKKWRKGGITVDRLWESFLFKVRNHKWPLK
jgi:hypothetical protein